MRLLMCVPPDEKVQSQAQQKRKRRKRRRKIQTLNCTCNVSKKYPCLSHICTSGQLPGTCQHSLCSVLPFPPPPPSRPRPLHFLLTGVSTLTAGIFYLILKTFWSNSALNQYCACTLGCCTSLMCSNELIHALGMLGTGHSEKTDWLASACIITSQNTSWPSPQCVTVTRCQQARLAS